MTLIIILAVVLAALVLLARWRCTRASSCPSNRVRSMQAACASAACGLATGSRPCSSCGAVGPVRCLA